MENEEIKKVYEAIQEYGDDFWNDDPGYAMKSDREIGNWNGYLFDEILSFLHKKGLDFKLVKYEPSGNKGDTEA